MQEKYHQTFYIISDSVGETAIRVTNAALAQFPTFTDSSVKRFPFINTLEELTEILEDALKHHATVVATLVNEDLHYFTKEFTQKNDLFYFNPIHDLIQHISIITNKEPSEQSGSLHNLDDQYFKRIQAIEFAVKYDDGKNRRGFKLADIVILGISRSSKTPLSMYLANKGYKVANLPIFPEANIPREIFEIPKEKIFGLSASPKYISDIRKGRVKFLGLDENATYS
ncbi:MAG: pyruvate, water dikinase regulatory protein, partial [Ruoffia tabacinasalis]